MDEARLKEGGTILTDKYFEEQLQRIREIRLSERKFYQKVTDIYATSIDYDPSSQTTRMFFARIQNKLHWAIHGETAAETIYDRAIRWHPASYRARSARSCGQHFRLQRLASRLIDLFQLVQKFLAAVHVGLAVDSPHMGLHRIG